MKILIIILIVLFILLNIFIYSTPVHRKGLVAPIIWFFILLFISGKKESKFYDFFFDSKIGDIFIIIMTILIAIYFFYCLIEGIIRIFSPDFSFYELRQERKYRKLIMKQGRYPGQLNMYKIYPVLVNNPDYEYIFNQCKNPYEKEQFCKDWSDYILDLQSVVLKNKEISPEQLYFTFDTWYRQTERWRVTDYHHTYYDSQQEQYKNKNIDNNTTNSKQFHFNFFKGIINKEDLHKRYKELLKIYHPDNHAGDTSITQQIQTEYQRLLDESN